MIFVQIDGDFSSSRRQIATAYIIYMCVWRGSSVWRNQESHCGLSTYRPYLIKPEKDRSMEAELKHRVQFRWSSGLQVVLFSMLLFVFMWSYVQTTKQIRVYFGITREFPDIAVNRTLQIFLKFLRFFKGSLMISIVKAASS